MKKKILFILLTLVMILLVGGTSVYADCCDNCAAGNHSGCTVGWTYQYNNATNHYVYCKCCGALVQPEGHQWVDGSCIKCTGSCTHSWSTTKAATCTTTGTKECSTCNKTETIPALGHSWGDWVTTTPATCVTDGVETRVCSRNPAHKETQPITATGSHDFSSETTTADYLKSAATCTAPAEYYYKCSKCDEKGTTTYTSGNPLGHDFTSKTVTDTYKKSDATCTDAAVYYYKCSRCTESSEGDTNTTYTNGSALGHIDESTYDGYCDRAACGIDLNTKPKMSNVTISGGTDGKYFKTGDTITVSVSAAKAQTTTDPIEQGEKWDNITFSATINGAEKTYTDTNTNSTSSSGTLTWNASDLAEGEYTVTVTAKDKRNLTDSMNASATIIIDKSAPAAPTITANPSTEWTNGNVAVTIAAGNADIAGLDHVSYVLSGATTAAETTGTSVTISNIGETTITAYTYDKAGNKSEAATKVVKIEKTAPTVAFNPNGSNGEFGQEFTTTVTVTDTGDYVSGVNASSLKYQWTNSTTAPAEGSFSSSFTNGGSITTPTNTSDNQYLWILAKDNAGNVTITSSSLFKVDNVKPTATFTNNTNTTYEKEHSVTVSVTDGGNVASGIDASSLKYQWTTSNSAPSADSFASSGTAFANGAAIKTPEGVTGDYYLWIIATDNAGNTAVLGSGVQKVDNTAPTAPTITANTDWTNQSVPVTITAGTDAHAGVDYVTYVLSGATTAAETTGTSVTITNEGETTITAYTYDKAGNKSEASESKTIKIEKIKPTVTYNPDGSNGEYGQSFTTVVTVEDLGDFISGVNADTVKYVWTNSTTAPSDAEINNAFTSEDEITTLPDISDNQYLWVIALDNATNKTVVSSQVFLVDNIEPEVTFTNNTNPTYAQEYKVLVDVTDEEGAINSGVDDDTLKYLWIKSDLVAPSVPTESDFETNGTAFTNNTEIDSPEGATGEYYLWVIAKDKVGNTIIAGSGVHRLDNNEPSIEFQLVGGNSVYNKIDIVVKDEYEDIERSGVDDTTLKYTLTREDDVKVEIYTNNTTNDFPAGLEGEYKIVIEATDNAGNTKTVEKTAFLDTVAPVITYTPNGDDEFANEHTTLVKIEDKSMLTSAKYVWTTDTTEPDEKLFEGTFNTSKVKSEGIEVTTPEGATGDYYLWVMAIDQAGNKTVAVSNVFKVDNDVPTVTFDVTGNETWKTENIVKVTVEETDLECGVNEDSLKYIWSKENTDPADDAFETEGTSFTNGENIETPSDGEGTYYLWIYAEDNIGNGCKVGSEGVNVDTIEPSITFEPEENKAYAQEHQTKVTFTDEGSGVKADSLKYVWTDSDSETAPSAGDFTDTFINGGDVVTPEGVTGVYYLWVMGEDNVGNSSVARSEEFWLDNVELPIELAIVKGEGEVVTEGITGQGIHIDVDETVKPFKEDSIKWLISDSTEKPQVTDFENGAENNADVYFDEGIETPAYVWVMAEDENGIVHMQSIYMIIDTKGPEVTFDLNGNSDDMSVVETTVTVEDYSSIVATKYMWTDDETLEPTEDDITTTFKTGDTIDCPLEDGDYYMWVYAEDAAGNVTIKKSEVFKVDHTAPEVPEIIGHENTKDGEIIPSESLTNQDVYIETIPGEDDRDEGVTTDVIVYVSTELGMMPSANFIPDDNGEVLLDEEGYYEVHAKTKDAAGNESDEVIYCVEIDKTAPEAPELKGNAETATGTEIPNEGTSKQDVVITITPAEDAETTDIEITKDGEPIVIEPNPDGTITLTEEGEYVITATSTDEAGNESDPTTYEVTLDRSVPEPAIEAKETAGDENEVEDGDATTENVEVKVTPVNPDETANVTILKDGEEITVDPNPDGTYTLTEDGEYEIIAVSEDEFGNESEEASIKFTIDTTAPAEPEIVGNGEESGSTLPSGTTVNESVIITINPGEDNREDAEVTITDVVITKDGDPITISPNADGTYTLTEEGEYVITAKNEDDLGNESGEATYTITIDTDAPNTPEIEATESTTGDVVEDGEATKEELDVVVSHDEDDPDDSDANGRKITTKTIIADGEGNDRTEDFKHGEQFVIDESGEFDITVTTTDENVGDPSDKIETSATMHVIVDLDAPTVEDDEQETEQNTKVTGTINPEDNFEVTEIEVTEDAKNGEFVIDEDGNYEYTPDEGYYGTEEIKVVAKDAVGNESEEATITIKVRKELEEVDVVTAKEKEVTTTKNKDYTSKALPENDKNGDPITYTVTGDASNGTVSVDPDTRKITYTPDRDYIGADTFEITADDGHETVTITFNVTVKERSSGGGIGGGGSSSKDDEEVEEHTWYVQGYEDGTVRPNGTITREEIATIFYRLMTNSEENAKIRVKVSYSDVDESRWSYDAIMFLTEKGILKGYEDGTFKPTAPITRAEFATILVRYLKITSKTDVNYIDIEDGYWAKDVIEKVSTSGLMNGYEDDTFKPNNKLTRAEAVTVINRMLQRNAKGIKVDDVPFSDLSTSHWAYSEMLEAITTHTCTVDKDNNYQEEWKSHEYPYLED